MLQKAHKRIRRRALSGVVALLALVGLLGAVPGANAHNAAETDQHGTIMLSFAAGASGCEISFAASGVDSANATLRILKSFGRAGILPIHEENLTGSPETEGDTFHYEAGPFELPFEYHIFELSFDGHATFQDWGGNRGCEPDPRVRVHQDETSGAVLAVEGCAFLVEGQHVRADSGRVRVGQLYSDVDTFFNVTADDMTPEEDGFGNRFMIPVEAELSGRHHVNFYADGEDVPQASLFIDVTGCSTEPPACPEITEAGPESHANVIFYDAVQDALSYRIYRAEGDAALTLLAEEPHPISIYQDADVRAGVTYTYRITAVGEMGESADCPTFEITRPDEHQHENCPSAPLVATANGDGSIMVTVDGLDRTATLMRSAGGAEFEEIATLDGLTTSYHDTDTEVGVTYTYRLVVEGEVCDEVEVTAIPVFPTLVAGALALSAGLVAYVGVRRRR